MSIKTERKARLVPNGIPRYVRCYDNGGDTIDRYTIVYTGRYKGRNGRCEFFTCNGSPFHPQGFGQHGEDRNIIDQPSYKHLGKKVTFESLPEDVKKAVMQDYNENWELN